MDLVSILIAGLFCIAVYLIARWGLGKLKVAIDDDILKVGAIILFILIVIGKVALPFQEGW